MAVGDCSGAGGAIGLADAVPCHHVNASFLLNNTITFNGNGPRG